MQNIHFTLKNTTSTQVNCEQSSYQYIFSSKLNGYIDNMAKHPLPPQHLVCVDAVQAEPACQDLPGSVDKIITLIREANVLGFPEVWIPAYPWYISAVECEGMSDICRRI